eukprot:scaffold1334_cov344-Prasinococcus_capsulatus_cf.AAC.13
MQRQDARCLRPIWTRRACAAPRHTIARGRRAATAVQGKRAGGRWRSPPSSTPSRSSSRRGCPTCCAPSQRRRSAGRRAPPTPRPCSARPAPTRERVAAHGLTRAPRRAPGSRQTCCSSPRSTSAACTRPHRRRQSGLTRCVHTPAPLAQATPSS